MAINYRKYSPKNFLEESRPEQWFFVLVPYAIGAVISNNFNWIVFAFLTFPYNFLIYRFDGWLEDKYGKGNYEILSAPIFYIIPFILGYGIPPLYPLLGIYLLFFSVNAVHSIGHKEINLKWAYVILPMAMLGAYALVSTTSLPIYFFYSFLVVGFSHLMLLLLKVWRDDYWLALFGVYVGVTLAFAVPIIAKIL